MPERENPEHESTAPLSDLFDNLPTPTPLIPTTDQAEPKPGSRRARREARAERSAGRAAAAAAAARAERDAVPTRDTTGQAGSARTASDRVGAASASSVPAGPVSASAPQRPLPAGSAQAGGSPHAASEGSQGSAVGRPADTDVSRDGTSAGAGTLDELFSADDHDDHGSRPSRRRRRTGCLVALVIVLALIGGAVGGGVWAWNTYGDRISEALGWGEPKDWEPGMATGEALVTINEGDTGEPVSAALYEAGVTKTEDVFYDYLIEENLAVTFYPGVYRLQQKMTAADALEALRDPANKMENTVGIDEGSTIASSLPGVAESIGIPLADLEAAVQDPTVYGVQAPSLEGWLFPAVYTFDPGVTATDIIAKMVERTRESLAAAGVPAGDEQRVLTIASIIQREGRVDDFAKVSRVIQNRLDIGMMLQMDSTAQYGYGELHAGVVSTSEEAQHDPNPWNTYVHEGLPIGPIASPSDAAIEAAMHPEDGPWLYFVTINPQTGETQFSVTYEEHQQGIQKWSEWCEANPGQGC